jgi:hypothetical protein
MRFASCFPDWNSLESVRRAHSDLEAAALVFFALLVVCEALAHLSDEKKTERRFDKIGIVFFAVAVLAEIAAYPYGQRNDALSAEMIGSLSGKVTEAEQKLQAMGKQADALTARMDTDSKKLDDIEYRTLLMGPREKLLVGKRRQKLVDALTLFAGQKIDVRPMGLRVTILGGLNPTPSDFEERDGLAKSLIGALNDAHWNAPTISLNTSSTLGGNGVSVHFFPDAPPSTRNAAGALIEALGKVPLATSGPTSDLTTTEESDKATIILVVHLR